MSWSNYDHQNKLSRLSHPRLNRKDMTLASPFISQIREKWEIGLPQGFNIGLPQDIPIMLAVGGGKGGVGKSIVSANVAGVLGNMGVRVLLIDLDVGSANLHTYFGLSVPQNTLARYLFAGQCDFSESIIQTPVEGVSLIAGGKDETWSDQAEINTNLFVQLWSEITQCKTRDLFDVVIFDLGAGNNKYALDFFSSAHLGIVTVLPEPTSIENAYSFLKSTMGRLLDNVGINTGECVIAEQIKELLFSYNSEESKNSYREKLNQLYEKFPQFIDVFHSSLVSRKIGFVVNQIRSQKDIEIGQSMKIIAQNYFGFNTCYLGHLNYDDAAWKALRNRKLLLTDFPHSILVRRIGEVAHNILSSLGY